MSEADVVASSVSDRTVPAAPSSDGPIAEWEGNGEPMPVPENARRFIEELTGSAETTMTFQTYDDDRARNDASLSHVIQGPVAWVFDELAALNAAGAGICVTINETDGSGDRKKENMKAVRALVADFDTPRAREYIVPPSFSVVTSPGRMHDYWLLSDMPLADYESVQRQLAALYGSDAQVGKLNQVMRLPGFIHRKGKPYVSRFVPGTGRRYSVSEVLPRPADENPFVAEARRFLETEGAAVSGNGGHDQTYRVVCELIRRFGSLSDGECLDALGPWNARCQPPWSNRDLLHKITDARRGAGRAADSPRTRYYTPAEALASHTTQRPRLSTGFPTLDEAIGGGIPPGKIVFVGGRPKAGKTAWLKAITETAAKTGSTRIGVIAYDGGYKDFAARLAASTSDEGDDFRLALNDGRVLLQGEEHVNIPDLATKLVKHREHAPSGIKHKVLAVDSIQTIAEHVPGTDVRLRNNAVVRQLTEAARQDLIVVATSHVGRESYNAAEDHQNVEYLTQYIHGRA